MEFGEMLSHSCAELFITNIEYESLCNNKIDVFPGDCEFICI